MMSIKKIITTLCIVGCIFICGYSTTVHATVVQTELITNGTSATTQNGNGPWTTASITPSSNALILAYIEMHGVAGAANATLSGNGLTWVQIASSTGFSKPIGATGYVLLFRAMGASPSTGVVTITSVGGSVTGGAWSIVQFTGVDTSGSNGSGAIVQTGTNAGSSVTSGTITLNSFASANNVSSAAFGISSATGITPKTGWTGNTNISPNAPSGQIMSFRSEYIISNDNTPSGSWSSANFAGVAAEVKASTGSAPIRAIYHVQGSRFRIWGGLFRVQ